jgi:predicted transcriptional regulator
MKTFTFKFKSNPQKKAFDKLKEVIKTRKPYVKGNEMLCDSLDTMLKLISKSRFEVFGGIVEHKPQSLYELAQLLDKDQGNVLRDAKVLENLGLIELKSIKDGSRERFQPKALFDKIVFEFQPKQAARVG